VGRFFEMNSHVRKYYRKSEGDSSQVKTFHQVIPIHEDRSLTWEKAHEKVYLLPKGWYELAQLPRQDRIDFVRDYWRSTLPFVPHIDQFLSQFFTSLDDIGVYILQWGEGLSFECEMVYSLKDDSCFYQGAPPPGSREIELLNDQFGGSLPNDFLKFLHIHNGFSKHTDTGICKAQDMPRIHRRLVRDVSDQNLVIKCHDHLIDPGELIPFYESFGLRAYQCFYREWYPTAEVGNIFFSLRDKTVSDFKNSKALSDTMAFPSFLDWLTFYLESIGD
jgi:hypothetical protein